MRVGRVLLGCLVAVGLALGLPVGASALSLASAVASGFASGSLSFSGISVGITGGLSQDLDDYAVTPMGDGFSLSGALTAVAGQGGTLSLSYLVSTVDPADTIAAVATAFDGQVLGTGAFALAIGGFTDTTLHALGTTFVYELGAGNAMLSDGLSFAGAASAIRVTQTIQVDAHGPGALLAAVGAVQQQFLVLGEPDPWLLFGAGALGLYGLGRRRAGAGGRDAA
jgi:hypothetical protein